ncbi:uncharacterized protein N7458_008042 [Penicillium daleae]|uniref:Uncharacterized protein n=1 Tax=Penicillium daleae TaxID=63821 RepID=A0AAD6C410_9EURO|nr:uncharacterized protein N7458_008042 [Penicillium daleae]KAJ5444170.1 hypothetical protein N7458_008042 [Penicillium daleae]
MVHVVQVHTSIHGTNWISKRSSLENSADLVNLASENGPDREPVIFVSVRAIEIGDLREMLHYANSSTLTALECANQPH